MCAPPYAQAVAALHGTRGGADVPKLEVLHDPCRFPRVSTQTEEEPKTEERGGEGGMLV